MKQLFVTMVCLVLTSSLWSQNKEDLNISSDKKVYEGYENIILNLSYQGEKELKEIYFPKSDDFQTPRKIGQSTNISIINGKKHVSLTYKYLVYPQKSGKISFNNIEAKFRDGSNANFDELKVEIISEITKPSPTQPQNIEKNKTLKRKTYIL